MCCSKLVFVLKIFSFIIISIYYSILKKKITLMEYRTITEFPKPYKLEATPYKQKGFSKKTLDAVNNKNPLFLNISKTIFVGDVSVGKTTIVNRFCYNKFNESYKATIGVDFEIENFRVLKAPFNLQIWDTAGQERFKCIAQAYYRNTNVIVVVFDMTKEETLKSAPEWLNNAMSANTHKPLIFLVGSKCDLLPKNEFDDIERSAIEIARIIEAEYWSVSAKTGYSIIELFRRIVALSFDEIVQQTSNECNISKRAQSSILRLNRQFISDSDWPGKTKCSC